MGLDRTRGWAADQVIDEVNSWVENASKGLIKELLPSGSLDNDTALALANAFYFKWSDHYEIHHVFIPSRREQGLAEFSTDVQPQSQILESRV
ncbi:hypothetical protein RJ640_021845 [Escallonia rubra]|uniref:Serpin domain-containing protein n=1 Tax=Escallonia rubra TaxID=112253 RepID=A0AA88RV47_9ASTE|nr:hypothetical protein RJ640_021845 [Escallonia rubra]